MERGGAEDAKIRGGTRFPVNTHGKGPSILSMAWRGTPLWRGFTTTPQQRCPSCTWLGVAWGVLAGFVPETGNCGRAFPPLSPPRKQGGQDIGTATGAEVGIFYELWM